jgi:hypothetical protein
MQKEWIKQCKWFLKKHVYFYATTCSLCQLDEKINQMTIWKFWNFEAKGFKGNDSFFKSFNWMLFTSLGSKFIALDVCHMCKK